jgi:hypothetical protein
MEVIKELLPGAFLLKPKRLKLHSQSPREVMVVLSNQNEGIL